MNKVQATVQAGVCGFVTEVVATSADQQHVEFEVTSTCEKITDLAGQLPAVDAYTEIGAGFEGELLSTVQSCLLGCCSGCAVPVGLFKAMQVAAGLALPRPVSIEIARIAE